MQVDAVSGQTPIRPTKPVERRVQPPKEVEKTEPQAEEQQIRASLDPDKGRRLNVVA